MAANPQLDGCAVDFATSGIRLLRAKPQFQALVRERGHGACSAHVCDITKDPLPAEALGRDGAGCDAVLLLYCLSALAPNTMAAAVLKLASALRPGGVLLFRDYGRHDEAQLRFGKGHKLGEHFYVKQDGTRVFYFTTDDLRGLMCNDHSGGNGGSSSGGSSSGGSSGGGAALAPNNGEDGSAADGAASASAAIFPHRNGSGGELAGGTAGLANGPGAGLEAVELSYIRRQYANRADQKARFRVWVHGKFRKPGVV